MSLFSIGSLLRGGSNLVGNAVQGIGQTIHAPDIGVSEMFGVSPGQGSSGSRAVNSTGNFTPNYSLQTHNPDLSGTQINPMGGGVPTAGYGGGGGGSTDAAAIAQARQSYIDNLGLLGKNQSVTQQQINDALSGAQSTYDQNLSRLNNNYNQQSDTLNQKQGLANQDLAGVEASRGLGSLGDSTYYQRAQAGQNLQYQNAFQGLDQDRSTQLDNLNNYLNQAKSQAQLQLYNMNVNDFQTLDQYQQALAEVNQHISDIDSQRSRALQAIQSFNPQAASVKPTFDAQNASDSFFNQINNLAKSGVTQKDLQGYINQYYAGDKDKLKNYSNFVNTLFQPVAGTQTA